MKILICIILLSLVSCNSDYSYNYKDEIIIITSIDEYGNNIVRYYTTTYTRHEQHGYKKISFLDSVNKFSIGDNKSISVNVGGNADEIYTLDVDSEEVYLLGNLPIFSSEIYENGIQIEEYLQELW